MEILELKPVIPVQRGEDWMTPICKYSRDGILSEDKIEAKRMWYHAARYLLYDGSLYRRGINTPLLYCLAPHEATEVLREIHENVCGNNTGGQSLAYKVLRQGYYWPTLKKDTAEYSQKCEKCQKDLTCILSLLPFAKWGIEIIDPLHRTPNRFKFAIVAMDYHMKWAEKNNHSNQKDKKIQYFQYLLVDKNS